MAGHRFGRTDGDCVGVLAKYLFDGARLAYVADVRGSRMGVDIVNLIRRYPGMLQSTLHCARRALAIWWRRSHMIRIGREAISCDFTIDFRTTRFDVLQFLHHHNARAFAHHKTTPVAIERARGPQEYLGPRAELPH